MKLEVKHLYLPIQQLLQLGKELPINICQCVIKLGPAAIAYEDNLAAPLGEGAKPESHRRDANRDTEACDDNDLLVNSLRNATDFFGVFNSYPNSNQRNSSSSNRPSICDSSPQLDLSLRRSDSSGLETQVTEKRHTLGHSNASAFSR